MFPNAPFCPVQGIFSDCNIIFLFHESEDINNKSLFPKLQWIPILRLHVVHDYVVFHCSIDDSVKFIIVDDNLFKNCSHFTLKWFQLNSIANMYFLEESYK